MAKRRSDPGWEARQEAERAEMRRLLEERKARFQALAEREARRRERLRRLTFGLLGR